MPETFQFTRDRLWIPMYNEYDPGTRHGTGNTRVFGRLKPGVSIERATEDVTRVAASLAEQFPDSNRNLTEIRVEPLLNRFVDRETRGLLLMMLAAVIAVLAIASINVTNLQFARAIAHARQLAVRTALGASRARLIAQIATECLVLVVLGGAAGVVASFWTTSLLEHLVGEAAQSGAIQPPPWLKFDVNGPVLAFSIAAAAASVVLAGIVPALFASRTNPSDVLRDGSRSHTGRFVNRLSAWLVTAQIALTCALLVASLLLVRTIVNRQEQSLGYDGTSVMIARMNLETDYHTGDELRTVFRALLDSMRSTPGVTHAALTSRRNTIDVNSQTFEIEGRTAAASPDDLPRLSLEIVSDGYFAAIGLQPLQGREFTPADGRENPVAIVNEAFARKYFAESDATGHRIRFSPNMPWLRIVGVVPQTLVQGPLDSGESDGAGAFVPVSVFPSSYISVVARGHGAPERLFEPLRRAVAKVNPNVALYSPNTPAKSFEQALLASRVVAGMFTVFAWVALVLATLGLYGVVSFAVNQRMHEFGIRAALGAGARDLFALVLRQGVAQFILGSVIGLGLTLWLVRLGGPILMKFLFRVDPHDPAVIAAAMGTLAIATLIACLVPARHAVKTDPLSVLRAE
jgi:predicted permease